MRISGARRPRQNSRRWASSSSTKARPTRLALLPWRCSPPNIDLHDFIERDAILTPVVELRGAGRGMRRHLARLLQRAAVLEIGGDAGAAEGVVAHFRGDASSLGAPAYYGPSVGSMQSLTVED